MLCISSCFVPNNISKSELKIVWIEEKNKNKMAALIHQHTHTSPLTITRKKRKEKNSHDYANLNNKTKFINGTKFLYI